MNTKIGHLVFSIDMKNAAFYRDLLAFLGWQVLYEVPEMLGMGANNTSIWFGGAPNAVKNDYDSPGLNHFALHTDTQADVDATVAYLKERNVPGLFDTPRHRPEFSGEGSTYYQVMFETPDRILVEVVYTGPKQ